MLTRSRSTRQAYGHTENGVQVQVSIPERLQIGPDGSRWMMSTLHLAHIRVNSELIEHHRPHKRVFSPQPLALPLGTPEQGEMIIEIRAGTTANRLMIRTYLRRHFEPVASILIEALKNPEVRKTFLQDMIADDAAMECWRSGQRVETPDDRTYEMIVDEIVHDPPSVNDVRDLLEEPAGLPRDVLRRAEPAYVPHHR